MNDPYDPKPTKANGQNHKRLGTVESGGYFCMLCGAPIEYNESGHGVNECEDNFDLVNELRRINGW